MVVGAPGELEDGLLVAVVRVVMRAVAATGSILGNLRSL